MPTATPEPVHTLLYGESGARKTTGAASYPTPMIVLMFDPLGKERPYAVDPATGDARGAIVTKTDADGTPLQLVVRDGAVLYRIEHYIDVNPRKPEAWRRFEARMTALHTDIDAWKIRTVVVDSLSFMELAARKEQQYRLNPMAKDPRQWFSGSTDSLEEVLMIQLGALRCNVVVIAHIDEDKDDVRGFKVFNPAAPGRLRKKAPAGFGEVHRAYVAVDDRGRVGHWWQTRSDTMYNASSQVGAPNPCAPVYEALWSRT